MAKNEVDSAIQTLVKLGCKVKKLWENASPTSDFPQQRLDVSWQDYDFLFIEHKYDTGADAYRTGALATCKLGHRAHLEALYLTSIGAMRGTERIINFEEAGLLVNNGWYQVSNTAGGAYPKYAIPVIIYGIKLLGGVQLKAYLRRIFQILQGRCRICLAY